MLQATESILQWSESPINMNIYPGGKQAIMRDTIWDRKTQKMVLPDGTPKGMKLVLQKRGVDVKSKKIISQKQFIVRFSVLVVRFLGGEAKIMSKKSWIVRLLVSFVSGLCGGVASSNSLCFLLLLVSSHRHRIVVVRACRTVQMLA